MDPVTNKVIRGSWPWGTGRFVERNIERIAVPIVVAGGGKEPALLFYGASAQQRMPVGLPVLSVKAEGTVSTVAPFMRWRSKSRGKRRS